MMEKTADVSNEKSNNESSEVSESATLSNQEQHEGKHKLETGWTFWFDQKSKDKATKYEDNLVQISTFHTIEDFWSVYTHLKRLPEVPKESNYHLFREGNKPMWETFPKGGCWIIKTRKSDEELMSRMWEELVFATIGEYFEDPDIVGIVVSKRAKEDAISIWNRDNQNSTLRSKIGDKLRSLWHLEGNVHIEYKYHTTSMKDRSTYRNGKQQYYVQ